MKKLIIPISIILIILFYIGFQLNKFEDLNSKSTKENAKILSYRIMTVERDFFQPLDSIETLLLLESYVEEVGLRLINSGKYYLVKDDSIKDYPVNYIVVNVKKQSKEEIKRTMKRGDKITFFDFLINDNPIVIDSLSSSLYSICNLGERFRVISFYKNKKFVKPPIEFREAIHTAFKKAIHNNFCHVKTEIDNSGDMKKLYNSYTVFKVSLNNPDDVKINLICTKCSNKEIIYPFIDSLSVYLNDMHETEFESMDSLYIKTWCILPLKDDL